MGIYFLCILLVCIYAILSFYKSKGKIQKITFLVLSFGTMFIIMALRDKSVGTDTILYYDLFQTYSKMSIVEVFKQSTILYILYNKVIAFFTNSNQWIIIMNAFIITTLTGKFIYDNSKNVAISTILFILLYHYIQAFNIGRQYIALIIVATFGFKKLVEGKQLRFILVVLVATFFHNTAIICLLLIIFQKIKLNYKNFFYIVLSSIFGILLMPYIIRLFIFIFPHYSLYFNGNMYFFASGEGRKIILTILYAILLFVNLLIKCKKEKNDIDIKKEQVINGAVMLAVIFGVLSLSSIVIGRIELYFSFYVILLIPELIEKVKKGKYLAYFIILLILFIPFYIQLNGNLGEVVPYDTFF